MTTAQRPVAPQSAARTAQSLRAVLVVAGAGLVGGLLAPHVLATIASLGAWIGSPDISLDYVKGVLWAALLGLTIVAWPVTRDERRALLALWVLRCVVVLGLMLFYEGHYESLDSFGYFRSSLEPLDWSTFSVASRTSGTRLMQALSWSHGRWLVASYHAMKVTWAMIGFVAVFIFYRAACIALGRRQLSILLGLSCFPSIVFWSSILGKDPITLLGIALFTHGVASWLRGRGRAGAFVRMGVGLALAATVRLWLAPILLAPLGIVAFVVARSALSRLALVVCAIGLFAAVLVPLRQRFAVEAFSDGLEMLQANSQAWAEGGSAQAIAADLSNPVELIKFIPRGMVAALFRPLPGEVNNAFGLLSGMEGLMLVTLLVVALMRARWADLRDPLLVWGIGFVLIWGAVYGPFSYQNLGTAVRFRLQVLPAMLLVLAYLARPRRAIDGVGSRQRVVQGKVFSDDAVEHELRDGP